MELRNELTQSQIQGQIAAQEALDEDAWSPMEIFGVLLLRRKFILGCMVGFMVLAFLYVHFCPKTYLAVATVELPATATGTANTAIRSLAALPSTGNPIATYLDVAQSEAIALNVIRKLDLLDNPQFQGFSIFRQKKLLPNAQGLSGYLRGGVISVLDSDDSGILTIQARIQKNPKLAADLANAWAQAFIDLNLSISQESAQRQFEFLSNQLSLMKDKLNKDQRAEKYYFNPSSDVESDEEIYNFILQQEQQAKIQANIDTSGIVVLDQALVPQGAIWPNLQICLILGLFLGLGVGVLGAFVLDRLQDRIKSEADLKRATGLIQLGLIPNFRREKGKLVFAPTDFISKKHLISNEDFTHSSYRESFKVFRTNFTFSNVDLGARALSVLSAKPGDGKTMMNADLALALAETGKKVLLVDADLRKPSVGILFGAKTPAEFGLPALLAGRGKVEDMVVASGIPNLSLLANGTIPPNPAELLGSDSFKKILEEMKSKFDYVLFDGAPVLPVTDSAVMAAQLDGVILMGRWDKTRRSEFRQAYLQLRSLGVRMLGTVLNAVDFEGSLYGYYGYGYGYGHGFDEKSKGSKSVKK
ncbi:MAG: polysaccharide biosynthesis tyrosine autokinase [bacterium]